MEVDDMHFSSFASSYYWALSFPMVHDTIACIVDWVQTKW